MRIRSVPRRYLVVVALIALNLAVFVQVKDHPFISYDDPPYVTENPFVREGLTKEGIVWAFTTTHMSNWHPLTWLSHMADVELFGLSPGGHHLINVLIHAANSALLFLVLSAMTGGLWQSGFAAALFAAHPLHVESVAWVAERKDVLSAFFWILAMWAYAGYARRRGACRYLLVALLFALGLLSKPMAVTLPFVLLLLDYWPLNRGLPSVRLLLEKVPLLALSLVSCVVTYVVQRAGGAVAPGESFPFGVRLANAIVSYVGYLWKTVWPASLSVFYPHPLRFQVGIPLWEAASAVLMLGVLTVFSVRGGRRCPYLPVGWFWYLGTLVPVIGLVQVGGQAMADRYTYVPLIGVFLLLAWGVPDLLAGRPWRRHALAALGGSVLAVLLVVSRIQTAYWKSNRVLFEHALAVAPKNWLASNHLGLALIGEGRMQEALAQFEEVLKYTPKFSPVYPLAHNNIGAVLMQQGKLEESMEHFRITLFIDPDHLLARSNLASALRQKGDIEEAIVQYREILRRNPEDHEALVQMNELQARGGPS